MELKLERAKEKQHNQKVCLKIFSRSGDTGLESQMLGWSSIVLRWSLGPHARQGLLGKLRLKDGKFKAHLSVLSRLCQKWVNSVVAFYSVRFYKFTGDISFLGWSLPSSPLISVKTRIILYQFVLPTLTPKDDTLHCNYIYTCTYVYIIWGL